MNPAFVLAGTCFLIGACAWASDRYGLRFLHQFLSGGSLSWRDR